MIKDLQNKYDCELIVDFNTFYDEVDVEIMIYDDYVE